MSRPKEFENRCKMGITLERKEFDLLCEISKKLGKNKSEILRLCILKLYGELFLSD